MARRSPSLIPPRHQPEKPSAVLVDVDGTLALAQGRHHYDGSTVSEDLPDTAIITVVEALHRGGHHVIVASGRTEAARDTRSLDKESAETLPDHGGSGTTEGTGPGSLRGGDGGGPPLPVGDMWAGRRTHPCDPGHRLPTLDGGRSDGREIPCMR